MMYQIALSFLKTVNYFNFPSNLEHATVIDQVICTSRKLRFQISRKNSSKIGMNETANKFYYITNLIGLEMLGLRFVY